MLLDMVYIQVVSVTRACLRLPRSTCHAPPGCPLEALEQLARFLTQLKALALSIRSAKRVQQDQCRCVRSPVHRIGTGTCSLEEASRTVGFDSSEAVDWHACREFVDTEALHYIQRDPETSGDCESPAKWLAR